MSEPPSQASPSASVPNRRASPKSSTFTMPSRQRKMLPGLMSRWTIPRACPASSPWQICAAMSTISQVLEIGAREAVLQRFALVVRHDDEQLPIPGRADVVDGAHVLMVDGCRRTSLLHEAIACNLVTAARTRQKLDCHDAVELAIARLAHDAHAAAPELGEHFIAVQTAMDERFRRARCLKCSSCLQCHAGSLWSWDWLVGCRGHAGRVIWITRWRPRWGRCQAKHLRKWTVQTLQVSVHRFFRQRDLLQCIACPDRLEISRFFELADGRADRFATAPEHLRKVKDAGTPCQHDLSRPLFAMLRKRKRPRTA